MKSLLFQKGMFAFILFLTSLNVTAQTVYNIDDPEKLRDVIYKPGDVIILKDGVYDTDERMIFLGSGTAENPVTFRAETPGGVVFTGGPRLTIGGESDNDTGEKIATGEYLVVDGFHWKGGYGASNFIEFRNGYDFAHHSTIQNCAIDGLGVEPSELAEDLADEQITKHRWIVLYGTYNNVINCAFMNKVTAGAIVLGEYSYNAFPNVPDGEPEINDSCAIVGHTIMNNYFYNFSKMTELYGTKANGDALSNAGDSETIRIGTSSYQMVNSNVTVSNNYFVQSDGENEIITNKSKGNTFTNNTFRRCRGSLVLRHGSYATVDGNYFLGENVDGTGGIRITDSEHSITNNYIQDCITVESNAKWNNGITFIGGSADEDVACTSDDVSNGYQKTRNINLSNNTLINTNAPLFYNEDKGSTDPTGAVSNNLIYFTDSNPNLTAVISGDSETAYDNLGTALNYSGNVFTGTTLGATNSGFTEEIGITATADGEIFTFEGTGSEGKGADMGAYEPATDAMVGYGIGACFLDASGNNILDGECTIQVLESLTIGNLPTFGPEAASSDLAVNANVSWTAVSNDSWISIDTEAGTGSATVSVSVTENTETSVRVGTVTFTQDPGGDDIVRTLTVTQEGAELVDLYRLINVGTGLETDLVTVHSFSKEEVNETTKFNYAKNTLDKDAGTVWAADDGAVLDGDFKGDGEYIIYDLGEIHKVGLIQFTTTNKSDAFGFQVLVSTTGADSDDFTMILPTSGELLLSETNTTDFNQFEVNAEARYVKLIGYGRFNSDANERKSAWTAVGEIEFYEETEQAVEDDDGDGVLNKDDDCPNTPDGEDVDENGCSESQLAKLIPSDLMENCKQWKITYPDGDEDKTLCDEPNNEYFYVNDAQDAIVFYAPIRSNNGTTPNSSYIRSELRELVPEGGTEVFWTTEGSHMVYSKQAITHLPMNKPELVATQIHGNKDDGIDDSMVLRLEEEHLFLSFNGGKLRSDVTIKTDYNLGDVHEVIFLIKNGKHYCYYSEDGGLLAAYQNGTADSYLIKADGNDYLMDLDYDDTYFKIGNYTQSNADEEGDDTDDPNNYGEVLVYDFTVEHGDGIDKDDLDGDGVPNEDDECPDSRSGAVVDANGCEVLRTDNFSIEIVSETCPDKSNGQLIISAQENFEYSVDLNGVKYSFTNASELIVDDLAPGSYEMCIEVVDQVLPSCYNFVIEEGTVVLGKSSSTTSKTTVEILEGTAPFGVFVNGQEVLKTQASTFDVKAKHGDLVEVKTAVPCEGVFAKTIQLFDEMRAYPNPTDGLFEISIPRAISEVVVEVYNYNSNLVSKNAYPVVNGKVQLDISNQAAGVYLVKVVVDSPVVFKIIKN